MRLPRPLGLCPCVPAPRACSHHRGPAIPSEDIQASQPPRGHAAPSSALVPRIGVLSPFRTPSGNFGAAETPFLLRI